MMIIKKWLTTLVFAFVLAGSSNFTYAQTSTGYNTAQQPVVVQTGRILQVRDVLLDASMTSKTTGGVLGGVIGALFGAKVAQHGTNNGFLLASAFGTLGAAGGAVVASQVAVETAQEIVVVMDDGRILAVAQSSNDGVRFFAGQKVLFLNGRIAPFLN